MAEMVLPGSKGTWRELGTVGKCLLSYLQAPILVQFWGRNQDAYKRLEIPELRHTQREFKKYPTPCLYFFSS